jgi:hypothetical protein
LNNNSIPQNVKDYFNKSPKNIVKVTPYDDHSLAVLFDNGELRKYNMSNKLFGVFEILKDINKFKQVFIDESGNIAWDKDTSIDSNIVWNNKIDICKDSIYLNSLPINIIF